MPQTDKTIVINIDKIIVVTADENASLDVLEAKMTEVFKRAIASATLSDQDQPSESHE